MDRYLSCLSINGSLISNGTCITDESHFNGTYVTLKRVTSMANKTLPSQEYFQYVDDEFIYLFQLFTVSRCWTFHRASMRLVAYNGN